MGTVRRSSGRSGATDVLFLEEPLGEAPAASATGVDNSPPSATLTIPPTDAELALPRQHCTGSDSRCAAAILHSGSVRGRAGCGDESARAGLTVLGAGLVARAPPPTAVGDLGDICHSGIYVED